MALTAQKNLVALLAASLRSALGPNCLISTSGAHSDLRFSIQLTSAYPRFTLPFSLKNTVSNRRKSPRPNSELFIPNRALTSAFGVEPAANRDRGAYKEALPFLFFLTSELNPVLRLFPTFSE